jgi:Fe2+ or Zn2+ uptake regulation protein
MAAYKRHLRLGETPCPGDYEANARYQRERSIRRKNGIRITRLSEHIVDALDIDGGWLTVDGLAEWLGRHPDTIKRYLLMLSDAGMVASRQVELAYSSSTHAGGVEKRTEWRLL